MEIGERLMGINRGGKVDRDEDFPHYRFSSRAYLSALEGGAVSRQCGGQGNLWGGSDGQNYYLDYKEPRGNVKSPQMQ